MKSEASSEQTEFRYYQRQPNWAFIDLKELWEYRDLLWSLSIRDLKVRYRQTVVGVAWAIIQPLVAILIFGILFRAMNAKVSESGVPYALTAMCGLLPWQLFAATLARSTESIVTNQQLVTKVYFPRVLLPLSTLIPPTVDMLISFGLLVLLMIYYGIAPSFSLLMVPFVVFFALLTSMAFSLWFAAINAIYRDVQYVVPFLIQSGLFISPVLYESSIVVQRIPAAMQWLYWLNPMVGVIESLRWAVLGMEMPPLGYLLVSFVTMALLFIGSLFYFRRMERFFADRV